jgi:membrane protease YdiL (CAAX protease family)
MLQPVCGEKFPAAAVMADSMTDSNDKGDVSLQEPPLRDIFFGTGGLRAGWGFALYLAMFALIVAVGEWLADSLEFGELWSQMVSEFGFLVAAVIPALVMARIEQRPWGAYGLPLRQAFSKLFWVGAIWGFLGISLLMEILHGLHAFHYGHVLLHGIRLVKFATFWGGLFLLVGFFEEFFLRGYAQFTLTRGMGFWPAAVMLSAAFGATHLRNSGEAWTGVLAAGFIGLFFCLTLRRTGNLWFAVGFHAAWDWGESFFYSVPDSGQVSPGHLLSSSFHGSKWITGGSVGPEGSLFCFVVIGVVWAAFASVYREVAEKEKSLPQTAQGITG